MFSTLPHALISNTCEEIGITVLQSLSESLYTISSVLSATSSTCKPFSAAAASSTSLAIPLDTAKSCKIRCMHFVGVSYQKAVVERIAQCLSTCWTTNTSASTIDIGPARSVLVILTSYSYTLKLWKNAGSSFGGSVAIMNTIWHPNSVHPRQHQHPHTPAVDESS